jgi:hypothetical protein
MGAVANMCAELSGYARATEWLMIAIFLYE